MFFSPFSVLKSFHFILLKAFKRIMTHKGRLEAWIVGHSDSLVPWMCDFPPPLFSLIDWVLLFLNCCWLPGMSIFRPTKRFSLSYKLYEIMCSKWLYKINISTLCSHWHWQLSLWSFKEKLKWWSWEVQLRHSSRIVIWATKCALKCMGFFFSMLSKTPRSHL